MEALCARNAVFATDPGLIKADFLVDETGVEKHTTSSIGEVFQPFSSENPRQMAIYPEICGYSTKEPLIKSITFRLRRYWGIYVVVLLVR